MANWYLTYSIFLLFAFPLREGKDRYFKGTIKFPGAILKYANFAQFRNHTLKTTVVMETRTVMSDEECLLSCSESPNCRSLNFNTTPDGQGRHLCQILDTDKFVSHFDFVVSSEFHHFSCTHPCENNPCKYGGTCYPLNGLRDFRCDCPPSVRGMTCSDVPYKDCYELLYYAGIGNTGLHYIMYNDLELPVYCDQEYLGGGWTMVFKFPSGNAKLSTVQKLWSKGGGNRNARSTELINVGSSKKYYSNRMIKNWTEKKPKEVHFALYRNETLVLSLIFNATGSDKLNWFSKTRLIYSPWTDLENGQTNYFSLMGNLSSNRSFYINKVSETCDGDAGWLMASSGTVCDYESYFTPSNLMYSKLSTHVNWTDYGKGEIEVELYLEWVY